MDRKYEMKDEGGRVAHSHGPRRGKDGRFEALREFVVAIPSEEEHMVILAKWALDKRWEN